MKQMTNLKLRESAQEANGVFFKDRLKQDKYIGYAYTVNTAVRFRI